ncbi:MAG: hypothetical protein JWO53_853, partial [Chlamydiia bacterium]|nr:hypothetical protein [Chlamydiia bacterium]
RPTVSLPTNKRLRLYSFRASGRSFGLYPPFDVATLVIDSTKELFYAPFKELKFYLTFIDENYEKFYIAQKKVSNLAKMIN